MRNVKKITSVEELQKIQQQLPHVNGGVTPVGNQVSFDEAFKIATSMRNKKDAAKFMQQRTIERTMRDYDKAIAQRVAKDVPSVVCVHPVVESVVQPEVFRTVGVDYNSEF